MKQVCSALVGMLVWSVLLCSRAASQGYSPDEAVRHMRVADGFEVQLAASEPLVRQPVAIEFDDRGRLWVIQYLQYPNPAGLKRVQVDRYSRTQYDRTPEPPPHGPRGADRITILSDSDGDGRMDKGHDFVTGLNLATGLAFGHGGVFVLNVPYLLFYPDRDRDDVPDGDPEVLLSGFGMEDAHSVANSLTWGPDGWLYGCQGSTVTANIRGIEFQQGVWRYHPTTREFELFCEGGGNSWGLDFDPRGHLFYSTNWGGHVLLHGVQGGYFIKSFAKHGELHNPHAYGYFDHAPHQGFRGGHVTVGGIVYQGESFPASFRGKYIAGDLLGHAVYWHHIEWQGPTVRTKHGGELLVANDSWFAPTDVTMGPDDSIYVSDWHDARTAHPDPDAEWDRSNGRIYRIAAQGGSGAGPVDFARLDTDELMRMHGHASQWYVRRARQELVRRIAPDNGERKASSSTRDAIRSAVVPALKQTSLNGPGEAACLEALWSLHALGGFDESLATELLASPHPAVRMWTVRFLGDRKRVSPELAHRLDEFAEQEPSVEVRQQLASTAARLPADQAMPIINANINRDIDHDDVRLPLLWWWAVERHSVSGREQVLKRFVRPTLWKSRLGRDVLLVRLVHRYAAERTDSGVDSVVRLLGAAPGEWRHALWSPLLQGWRQGATAAQSPDPPLDLTELNRLVADAWSSRPADPILLQLNIALGNRAARDAAVRDAFDRQVAAARRVELLDILARAADASLADRALALVRSEEPEPVREAALRVLSRFDDPQIAAALIDLHRSSTSAAFRSLIRDVMLGRRATAAAWLHAVDSGQIEPAATPLDQVRRVAAFQDAAMNRLVARHWGKLQAGTQEELLAEVRRLNNDLRAGSGNAGAGQSVFKKHCASCHTLFGEGTKIGPDLTSANRQDRDFMLISLVDPNSVIRKEFVSVVIQTKDGRVLTGLPVARLDSSLTLLDAKNQSITVLASEIDEIQESAVSMMPGDLYRQLTPQELRDLFAYLQSSGE